MNGLPAKALNLRSIRSVEACVPHDQHINHQSPDAEAEGRRLPKSHDCFIMATLDCILIVMTALWSCSRCRPPPPSDSLSIEREDHYNVRTTIPCDRRSKVSAHCRYQGRHTMGSRMARHGDGWRGWTRTRIRTLLTRSNLVFPRTTGCTKSKTNTKNQANTTMVKTGYLTR
jgi:hypothetical protein